MKNIKNCEICGSKDIHFLFKQRDKNICVPGTFSVYKCNKCKVLFLNPKPSSEELKKYYSSNKYYSLKDIQNKESKKTRLRLFLYNIYFNPKKRNLFLKILFLPIKFFIRGTNLEKEKRILDIGSGNGQFLYEMKELGMDVYGVEPGDFNQKETKKYGLNIEKTDFLNYKSKKEYFDIITMNHVLEHVSEPKIVLEKIKTILKKDGLLILGIPNTDSLAYSIFSKDWHQLDVPRHLFDYSNKNIVELLKKKGFSIIKIRYNSRPNQFVVSLYFKWCIKNRKSKLTRILDILFLPLTWIVNIIKKGDQIEIWCKK